MILLVFCGEEIKNLGGVMLQGQGGVADGLGDLTLVAFAIVDAGTDVLWIEAIGQFFTV